MMMRILRMMQFKRGLRALVSLLVLLPAARAGAELPVAELSAGMYRIEAEVAASFETRAIGLMNRPEMAPQHGMLFIFTEDATHCMWMRNTLLPLSVAFLDGDGRIINIEQMQPRTEDNHCAARPARYALEMNLGWFAARGLKPGARISGIPKGAPPN